MLRSSDSHQSPSEMPMNFPTQTGRFALGDLKLQSGEVLRDAALSWKSYGALSPARDNVIVYPTSYTAKHTDQEWLIAQDKVLDPTRWFIVTPDMFESQQHAGLSASRHLVASLT
jgi:homoserine O-acetyltransferase/O-succinyltransferase